ncbi:MAG TPA: hypothetical protein V6D34_11785 [Candidatus Sericytochromatia bacterium]
MLFVRVTAANLPTREGGKRVRQQLAAAGHKVCRLYRVWVVGGSSGRSLVSGVRACFR